MWEVTNEIQVDNSLLEKFSLGISKNTCIQLGDVYYHSFTWDRDMGIYSIFATTYIDTKETNKSVILHQALEKISLPNAMLSFLCNFPIGIKHRFLGKAELVEKKRYISSNTTNKNVKKIHIFNSQYLKSNEQNHINKCIRILANSLHMYYILDYQDEAVFNLVKVIEIISNNQWKEKYKHEFESDLFAVERKIINNFIKDITTEKNKVYNKHFGGSFEIRDPERIDDNLSIAIKQVSPSVGLNYKLNKILLDNKNKKFATQNNYNKLIRYRNDFAHGSIIRYSKENIDSLFTDALLLAQELISYIYFKKSYSALRLKITFK